MQVFRGVHHPGISAACGLTIGSFDGVHRGHQAMLALLINEARHRSVPSCVMTFEPHPRDHFAHKAGRPEAAPARVATLRDKLAELERCGIEHVVVVRFDERFAAMTAQTFIHDVLVQDLKARYVLVGDDFRFGASATASTTEGGAGNCASCVQFYRCATQPRASSVSRAMPMRSASSDSYFSSSCSLCSRSTRTRRP